MRDKYENPTPKIFFLSSCFTSICNPLGFDRPSASLQYTNRPGSILFVPSIFALPCLYKGGATFGVPLLSLSKKVFTFFVVFPFPLQLPLACPFSFSFSCCLQKTFNNGATAFSVASACWKCSHVVLAKADTSAKIEVVHAEVRNRTSKIERGAEELRRLKSRLAIVCLVSRPDQLIRKFSDQTTTKPVD